MRTPGQALMWELWRISRWEFIIRVAGQSVCWVPIMWFLGAYRDGVEVLAGFALLAIVGTSVFSGTWMNGFDNNQAGYCFHLQFSRPISTPFLVIVPMAYIACTSALCFLIPAGLLRLLFGIPFPLLPATAFIVTCSACLVGAVWSSPNLLTRILSLAGVAGAFGGLIFWRNRQPDVVVPMLISTRDWPTIFDVSILQYIGLLLVTVCAVAVTTFAVGRQRHGEQLQLTGFRRLLHNLTDRLPKRTRPFRTPARAQFWFEMRRSGVKVLLVGCCASVLAFVLISYANAYSDEWRGNAVAMWLMAVFLCPFAYQLLSAEWSQGLKRRQGAVWLSTFDAMQGLGNDSLMAIKLAVLATSVFVGWLAMVCAAVAHTALWGDFQEWAHVGATISPIAANVPAAWWAVVAIIMVVIYASSSALFVAVGLWLPLYSKVFGAAFAVVFAHYLLAVWDFRHDWALHLLWSAYGWILAAALVGVAVIALRKSLKWGFLDRRVFRGALCAWTVFLFATIALYLKVMPATATVPPPALALGLGMMSMPLATVAIAPLAFASHRHR